MRRTLEDLGPLYIKVGQILATRPDLVPLYLREELAHLNDQAVVRPFSHFEPVLEQELGTGWQDRFAQVRTERPLGAASLAQVYKATLTDGRQCVLKVRRPGAEQLVHGDMRVLRTVAALIARAAPRFAEVVDVRALLDALFDVMGDELDFTREASNMKAARKLAKDYTRIRVPKVLHATPRVLVQSFADGVPINRVKKEELDPKEAKRIACQLIDYMFRSYFVTGRFHADPHPGNIIISPGRRAYLIDWGMVGRLDRSASVALLGAFLGMACNDGERMARQWIKLGTNTPWSNPAGLVQDLSRIVPRWSEASLAELNFGVALMSLLRYSTRRGVQITPMTSVLGKSVANIEGSVRYIYPELRLSHVLRKVLRGVMRDLVEEELSTERLAQHLLDAQFLVKKSAPQVQAVLEDMSVRQATVQARTNLGNPIRPGRFWRR
ncbi:ABC1 kinase family protein [Streptomyces huiliensis]|uniref:ABC1 kinase family protein n=1 Tax=Streptomyces huiliensis TaxID=2876027 RepID=UPI001CBC8029|nr:AarF/UbiB family protein [Streptomyces huiliensis]